MWWAVHSTTKNWRQAESVNSSIRRRVEASKRASIMVGDEVLSLKRALNGVIRLFVSHTIRGFLRKCLEGGSGREDRAGRYCAGT